ncbi:SPOR domain-containing protein [Pseudoalteromonas piscicida]|uniref:SPOR domain-containing protein n=1 Tax=Pseudoalteromonas piscicida TaxID=43662 RepID=A0A2A5JUU5_PSEO7|nr:SPOR domain-containing protein [Pseudoalteromonas piscicida]PCK33252.1 hypothetical protein CEX98_02810 [Pseudoalteromonas piscicida]
MRKTNQLCLLLTGLLLSGCKTSPNNTQLDALEVKKQLSLLSQQVSTLQQEVEQLRSLKQQVAKFEAVQEDLDIIAMQLSDELTEQKSAQAVKPHATNTHEKQTVKQPKEPEQTPEFAIQLASTTDYVKVRQTYEQIKQKLPAEFAKSEVNIEQVNIQDTKYYRLKLGAFLDKASAFEGCKVLKRIGLNCLVSHYTSHRL